MMAGFGMSPLKLASGQGLAGQRPGCQGIIAIVRGIVR
jgi:hypothetical protein